MKDERGTLDVEKIRGLAALMERHGLSRLSLEEGGLTIRLETAGAAPAAPAVLPPMAWPAQMAATVAPGAAAAPAAPAPVAVKEPEGVPLPSPTTGTFYRAPSPVDPPYVEVGDRVSVGQTIGIIMAMKVMSEVPAETAGVVTAIPAQDGELVQSGAPLIIVNPSS